MAQDPASMELQRPISAREVIKNEARAQHDCLSCRLLGTGMCMGVGGYTLVSGMMSLNANKQKILKSKSIFGLQSRQSAIIATSLSFFGLAWYRWTN